MNSAKSELNPARRRQTSKSLKERRALQDLEERRALQDLCNLVNDPPNWMPGRWPIAGVQRFKEWVTAWRDAPSLQAAMDDLNMGLELEKYIRADYFPSPSHHGVELKFVAGRSAWKQNRYTPDEVTLELFARLVINPQCEMFGGPCPHCKKCFVKKKQLRQVFCDRRCNSAHTAPEATKKRRDDIRDLKIDFAESGKCKYEQLRNRPHPWQRWVAREATTLMRRHPLTKNLPDMKQNFVTLNIKPPKEAEKTRLPRTKIGTRSWRIRVETP